MRNLEYNDYKILNIFKNHKEAPYVKYFHISYEMEYYYILVDDMLKNKDKLTVPIDDKWNTEKWKDICEYIKKYGTWEVKTYFALTKIIVIIANKYYDKSGKLKGK